MSSSMSVSVDCSVLSCAWKAPRVLTGSLASTAQSSSCSSPSPCPPRRFYRRRYSCKASDVKICCWSEGSWFGGAGWVFMSSLRHPTSRRWNHHCSSTSGSESFDDISSDSLWEDLRPTIAYLPPGELGLVRKALKLAFDAHNGQKRRSGEPFIIHPVEVARILGELELDWESIAAGLLHDTVEDTNVVTFEQIEKDFGSSVRDIVEGETKVSKLGKLKCKSENSCANDVKADDLQQMFLAMTKEVRVIIVKSADRLHNMRTLSHMPSHKQASIAKETLQVFAPLAKLLGMYKIKSELENLSFMYTNAQEYEKFAKRVSELYQKHERELDEANKILTKKIEDNKFLDLMTVRAELQAVCKEPYSIYKAVSKAKISINDIKQIAQLHIIIKPKSCTRIRPLCSVEQICYHVLGLIHGIWPPIPQSMKDYIATPKANGYQSLHTTVIPFLYESMFQLEVQIRTEEMDLIAQRGIAALYCGKVFVDNSHGNLKGKSVCLSNNNIALRIGWLNAIREWQEEFVGNMSSREFVEVITRDLLGSRIFVFTPRGEIKNLPKGATVVDYAYMIHTEIGNKMVAAKVNGNCVSPTHVLANAEVVEIITDKALSSKFAFQKHKQWLRHAKTRSARHKIMRFLKEQATLCAEEITADSVRNFIADPEKESKAESSDFPTVSAPISEKIESSSLPTAAELHFHLQNGGPSVPKVNGKHNKHVELSNLKEKEKLLSWDHDLAKMIFVNTARPREVLPCLGRWQTSKIVAWHSLEGNSIQWLCVVSIDQRGIMGEVTTILAALGISICSCVAEIDRGRSMGVMLFHIEGSLDKLGDACSRIELIYGVLEWSVGCSWLGTAESGENV